jgi:hypothetical protein
LIHWDVVAQPSLRSAHISHPNFRENLSNFS